MERRERYDPEDIENLLTERRFDELLEEERAFVLKHLSGREEYDRMRAMLHYVRPDERSRAPIETDDRVRVNVLEAFRAQQRPQWRIWLNSITVWLTPQESSSYWRPALAFASLALLVVVGVYVVQRSGNDIDHSGLAELRKPERTNTERPVPTPSAAEESAGLEGSKKEVTTSATNAVQTQGSNAETTNPASPMYDAVKRESLMAKRADAELLEEKEIELDFADDAAVKSDVGRTLTTGATDQFSSPTGHVVTEAELATNMSLANASGVGKKPTAAKEHSKATAKDAKNAVKSRNMAADAALLDLLAKGW